MKRALLSFALLLAVHPLARAEAGPLEARIATAADAVEAEVIGWRRDFHQHPELSNREVRTAKQVAKLLRGMGLDEVHTGIAHNGVVGVLKGGKPGPTVALRADMDALPVQEPPGLPFASTAQMEYNGQTVPVMHACGHDAHMAMLLGAARVLTGMRADIPGTVAFVFQPAEEGAPAGEAGGARLMLKEGLLELAHRPQAIFGLHVWPVEAGVIGYRERGAMAAGDILRITVTGRQSHGSSPWAGVDPITVAAQIIGALQSIPSRQLDVTKAPSVISIGSIHGGLRDNIIPEKVELTGTMRNFDESVRAEAHARVRRTAEGIAAAAGAKAEVTTTEKTVVTFNDPALMRRMLPSLERAAPGKVVESPLIMASEDFSFYQREIPGLFLFLGINEEGVKAGEAPSNHSPLFRINEAALKTGVKTLSQLAVDFLAHDE